MTGADEEDAPAAHMKAFTIVGIVVLIENGLPLLSMSR